MKIGIDYLGAGGSKDYQQTIVDHHPNGWAAGFLLRASGWKSPVPAIRALARTNKCPVFRIHFQWHDNHNFTVKDIAPAVRGARRVAKLAEEFPKIKFFYSPWLEHRASNALFRKCKKACREVLPKQVKVVCCGPTMPRGINEVHHSAPIPGRYIYSYDGQDMFEENVRADKAFHSNALIFFCWIPRCNGRASLYDTTPRQDRKDWLTAKDIKRMVEMTK